MKNRNCNLVSVTRFKGKSLKSPVLVGLYLSGLLGFFLLLWSPWIIAQESEEAGTCCRIAVVNVTEVLSRSPQSVAEQKRLSNAYEKREKRLVEEKDRLNEARYALQRISASLSNQERVVRASELRIQQRNYSRNLEEFREDLRFEKDKALGYLQEEVIEAIEAVRKRENIDIIFRENNYIAASKRVNLTDKVLSYLQEQFELQDTSTKKQE